MMRNIKIIITTLFLVVLSAFLIILDGNSSFAADGKNVVSAANVNVQVNEGNLYFNNYKDIKVSVDASANPSVNMFTVVICHNDSGKCNPVDAKYRYNKLEGGKLTITASLEWIEASNKDFRIEKGAYTIKVKPESKKCHVFCPITDVIKNDDENLRFITVPAYYQPLNSSDLMVLYNGVALNNTETTPLETAKLEMRVQRHNQVYGQSVVSGYAEYCLADNNWSISWNSSSIICKQMNLQIKDGSAAIDLSNKDLEGNYILKVYVKTNDNVTISKAIRFTYDFTAPKVTIDPISQEITKSKDITYSVMDHSATKTKYLVKKATDEKPLETEFKEYANSNVITVKDLSGSFVLWTLTIDNSGNSTISSSDVFHLDNSAPIIEGYEHYIDFYNKELIIQVIRVKDQIDTGITYFVSLDGNNYQEYTSNLIHIDIASVIGTNIKVHLYAKDKLGNYDLKNKKEFVPVMEETDIDLSIENATANKYYNNEVNLKVMGNDIISIKVNSFEYINNRFFCTPIMEDSSVIQGEKIIAGYNCKFNTDGIYNVVVKNYSEETSSISFIINKNVNWIIDGKNVEINEMFIVKVSSKGDKFYGSLPISVYDLKKDIKLVYLDRNNTYKHLPLLENKETIALNEITSPKEFVLPIDVLSYQKANELIGTGEQYLLAYSIVVDREDNNVIVEIPQEKEEANTNQTQPTGNDYVNSSNTSSSSKIFSIKNVTIVAIVIVVVIYLLKFFVYKKNINTIE